MPDSERPSRRKKLLFFGGLNLVLLLGVFAAFMWVTERYIESSRPSTLVYQPHPFQRHVLAAGQSYRRGRTAFEIGPHHLRGPVPELPKPEEELRVYVVGGSSVFDHLVTGGESWPERLGPELEARGLENVRSFNGGVPGYSSRETLAAYYDRVSRFEPDVVVFYLGWNDVKYMVPFREEADPDLYYSYRGIFETQYRFLEAPRPLRNWYALEKMVGARLAKGEVAENAAPPRPEAPGEGIPWRESGGMAFWRRNIETFVTRVRAEGARPVLAAQVTLVVRDLPEALRDRVAYHYVGVDHDTLVELNELMVRVLEEVAEARDVPFIDVREEMNGRPEYFSDHVHLKAEGSHTLARLLAERLAPVLSSTVAR